MQQLCAYETVALGYSKFCELFTEEEWRGFDYSIGDLLAVSVSSMIAEAGVPGIDLNFWYGYGPGNPTAAAMGIGWVQELVARLTKTPLTMFDTSTNGTLDSSNITFPLDQPIYVDASHDSFMADSKSAPPSPIR